MNFKNRVFTVAVLLTQIATFGYSKTAATSASALDENPKLVVQLVVGGVRYDQILKFKDNLSDGGIKKLIDSGSSFTNAQCGYMYSTPECGSATLAAGTTPAGHGVLGESWVNYTTNELVSPLYNKRYKGLGSNEDEGQYSPEALIFSTLADEIKGIDARSKVVSVAHDYKDAIIHGGSNPDGCYWYDVRYGGFATSSYYKPFLPQWVASFNNSKLNESYNSTLWSVDLPIERYKYRNATAVLLDSKKQFSFDMLLKPKNREYQRLIEIPMGNSYLKDFALEAIKRDSLGADNHTDLLVVDFAAYRNVSRIYGSESTETEDAYYKLDRDIADFISYLEQHIGKDNFTLVLTSSHGMSGNVENKGQKSGKFNAMQFEVIVGGFLNAQLGANSWIIDYKNRQIYLNRRLIYERGLSLQDIQTKVAAFALQFEGISNAVTATSLQSNYFGSGIMRKMQQSYFPRHGGDVIVNLLPGWIEIVNDEDVRTTSLWGSPYIYDNHIPMIFYGKGIKQQKIHTSVELKDVAPTISELLKITHPNSADGRAISEIIN